MEKPKKAGHYNAPPEDLTKAPPKLIVDGEVVTDRPRIEELAEYFAQATLPAGPFDLGPGQVIVDAQRFVSWSLAGLNSSGKRELRAPFYYRLLAFKVLLEKSQLA